MKNSGCIFIEMERLLSFLHGAYSNGIIEAITGMMKTNSDINLTDQYNRTPLWNAIKRGNNSVVDSLLENEEIDVNIKTSFNYPEYRYRGITPLMLASILDDYRTVDKICQKHPDVNVTDITGRTPLHYACHYGRTSTARVLLSYGAYIDVYDQSDTTPLYIACKEGREDVARLLLEKNEHSKYKKTSRDRESRTFVVQSETLTQSRKWRNPLIGAIKHGEENIVKLLIRYDFCVSFSIEDGRTPLHLACSEGTLGMVSELTDAGCEVNCTNNFGQTPIFMSFRFNSYLSLKRLLDVNKTANYSQEMELLLSDLKEGLEISKYMIEKGAALDCRDRSGISLFEAALNTGRILPTVLILKYGVEMNTYIFDEILEGQGTKAYLIFILLKLCFRMRNIVAKHIDGLPSVHIKSIILSEIEKPMSLKDQCRIRIRNSITVTPGLDFQTAIYSLPLPELSQSFLLLNDIENYIYITINSCSLKQIEFY